MKNLIYLLVTLFVVSSCSEGNYDSETELFQNNQKNKNKTEKPEKVAICHKGKTISISSNAVNAHKDHGDAVDMDGDGFFDIENDCSEVDCDDNAYSEDNTCIAIGDYKFGGIVFWIDPNDKNHGLVLALNSYEDSSRYRFGRMRYNDAESMVLSKSITIEGITYDDWFIPSKDQFELIRAVDSSILSTALNENGGNSLYRSDYNGYPVTIWTSTMVNNPNRRFVNYGYQYLLRGRAHSVRPVRAF